jgi:hypothetical protein
MEANSQIHSQAILPLVKESPSIHWKGGWVDPTAGLDAMAKRRYPITVPAGNWTPVAQPVAWSLYWLSYPDTSDSTVEKRNYLGKLRVGTHEKWSSHNHK